ncbi:YihY/virulence factor BrkB family protein [Trueperella sp. LYQ143]|uniref:YihY/virulence factor BrkB family protein n=1 Tax=Trueperella sp. LYQ143 TaxID=3391059 RepID=UPI0039833D70
MAKTVHIRKPSDPPIAVKKAQRYLNWIMRLRIVRAFQRYGNARGALISGGIAYSAMFSIAGALTVGLTVFSYVLGGNTELREGLFSSIESSLPGVLKTHANPNGLLDPDSLIVDSPLTLPSIVALLVLLWSSISLMSGMRSSILAMFGLSAPRRSFVVAKLMDLSGLIVMGGGVVLATVVVSAARFFAGPILAFLGIPRDASTWLLTLVSYVVAAAIDFGVVVFLIRVMSGVRPLRRDLVIGGLVGAIGSGVLRYLGTSVASSVSDNKLLAPFAAIATLLLWVNLLARIILLSAAVTANPPAPGKPTPSQIEHLEDRPNYVTESDITTKMWNFDPRTGVIAPDRPEPREDPIPDWSGWRERRARKRIAAAKQRVTQAEAQLAIVRDDYRRGAWDAFYADTRHTTNAQLAGIRRGDIVIEEDDK